MAQYTLFTNLQCVTINPGTPPAPRLDVQALLLENRESLLGGDHEYCLRGFGTDPAWVVFDVLVTTDKFTLTDNAAGVFLQVGDLRLRMLQQSRDPEQPVRVQLFGEINTVWEAFRAEVPRYREETLNMPGLVWGPPSVIGAYQRLMGVSHDAEQFRAAVDAARAKDWKAARAVEELLVPAIALASRSRRR